MKLLNNDIIFKNVFNDDEIMKRLIGEALNLKVSRVEQLNTELEVTNIKEKRKILDIIAYTDKGVINIEVNNGYSKGSFNRNLLYFCKLLGGSVKKTEDYINIDNHIQLNLTWNLERYLEHDTSNDRKYEFKITEEKLGFNIYTDYFKIVVINMDYYKDKCYNELNLSDRFFKVLAATSLEDMKNLSRGDEVMEKITKKVESLNANPNIIKELEIEDDYLKLYNSDILEAHISGVKEGIEQGIEQGIEKGIEQGKKEGLEQGKKVGVLEASKEIAVNMIKRDIDKKTILEVTGLTIEELNKLDI